MMSVSEYAIDMNLSIEEVLSYCKKLNINATDGNYSLDQDEITMLDSFISANSDEAYNDEYVDDDELEQDLRIDTEIKDKSEV